MISKRQVMSNRPLSHVGPETAESVPVLPHGGIGIRPSLSAMQSPFFYCLALPRKFCIIHAVPELISGLGDSFKGIKCQLTLVRLPTYYQHVEHVQKLSRQCATLPQIVSRSHTPGHSACDFSL